MTLINDSKWLHSHVILGNFDKYLVDLVHGLKNTVSVFRPHTKGSLALMVAKGHTKQWIKSAEVEWGQVPVQQMNRRLVLQHSVNYQW